MPVLTVLWRRDALFSRAAQCLICNGNADFLQCRDGIWEAQRRSRSLSAGELFCSNILYPVLSALWKQEPCLHHGKETHHRVQQAPTVDYSQPCHQVVRNLCAARAQSFFKAFRCLWQMKIAAFPFCLHRTCIFGNCSTQPSVLQVGLCPAYYLNIGQTHICLNRSSKAVTAEAEILASTSRQWTLLEKNKRWSMMEDKLERTVIYVYHMPL